MQAGIAYFMSSLFICGNKSRRINESKIKIGGLEKKAFAATGVKIIPSDEGQDEWDGWE